jgi:hypothetical protein
MLSSINEDLRMGLRQDVYCERYLVRKRRNKRMYSYNLRCFVISTHLRPAFIIIFDFIMASVIVVAITAIDVYIHCSRLLIFESYCRPSHSM